MMAAIKKDTNLDELKSSRDISKKAYEQLSNKEAQPQDHVIRITKPTLNLYKGGWYKTRDGRKAKITRNRCSCSTKECGINCPWVGRIYNTCKANKKYTYWDWTREGKAGLSYYGFENQEKDLVEELGNSFFDAIEINILIGTPLLFFGIIGFIVGINLNYFVLPVISGISMCIGVMVFCNIFNEYRRIIDD